MVLKTSLIIISLLVLSGVFGYWYFTNYQESFEGDLSMVDERLVVFDFDGTLCDSFQEAVNIFNEISSDYNLMPIKDSEINTYKSMPTRDFLEMHGVTTLKLPLIHYKIKKVATDRIAGIKTFDGMRDLITDLRSKGYKIGILTSNSLENVKIFFDVHKYEGINFIYHGSSVFGKDRLLKHIREQSKASEITYVGDEVRDIEACQKVGIPIIAVTWGYNAKEFLEKHTPNHIVSSATEILSILK